MIKSWILGLTGAAILTAVAMAVTPEGRVKKVTQLVCGAVVILALISPVVGFDYETFAISAAMYRQQGQEYSQSLEESSAAITRLIIEEECEAYILDKGARAGAGEMTVSVEAQWSEEGCWYPCMAEIKTDADESVKKELCMYIEGELGIPEEKIIWSVDDEK